MYKLNVLMLMILN